MLNIKTDDQFKVDKADVGARIKGLRDRKEMTQLTLAKLMSKSRSAIAQWETGNALPDLGEYHALAFYLNSTAQYIAFGIDDNSTVSIRVPMIDYDAAGSAPIGEMSIDPNFMSRLQRSPSARIRAFTLPRNDMADGLSKGDVVIIDEMDREVIGAGEMFLIFQRVAAVAQASSVPGRPDAVAVKIGTAHLQVEAATLPIVGRIVATLRTSF